MSCFVGAMVRDMVKGLEVEDDSRQNNLASGKMRSRAGVAWLSGWVEQQVSIWAAKVQSLS